MNESERPRMTSNEFIDEKTVVQPQDLLQVDIKGLAEETSFRPQIPVPTPAYHPSYLESNNFGNRLLYGNYNSSTNIDRFPFFGHHLHDYMHYPSPTNLSTTAPTTPSPVIADRSVEKSDDKKSKRSLQQRIRRLNETPEQKEARRQKNRELNRRRRGLSLMSETAEEREIRLQKNREINRRRRALLKQTGISTEQSRNRLRQRIKREISRMLRTGEKREDFLKETFADIRIYFNDTEYNKMYQRVLETLEYVRCKKV